MEFARDFDDLLQKNSMDHRKTAPNHPQADGLAERAAQTIKRSARKSCEMSATPKLWDKSTPWITLGYNSSTKASTKMSPCYMLNTRHPVVPPAHVQKFSEPIDLYNAKAAAKSMLERADVAQKAGIMAGSNLKIAQHRDILRYATIRGGGYLPSIWQFAVGDFVHLRRRRKKERKENKKKNYASSKKLLTSIKEMGPLGKKSPFTTKEKGGSVRTRRVAGRQASRPLLIRVLDSTL